LFRFNCKISTVAKTQETCTVDVSNNATRQEIENLAAEQACSAQFRQATDEPSGAGNKRVIQSFRFNRKVLQRSSFVFLHIIDAMCRPTVSNEETIANLILIIMRACLSTEWKCSTDSFGVLPGH
jgi:hypothetical protein